MDTTGFFDIKSSNFLGGTNVHNLAMIVMLGALVWKTKAFKK